MSETINYENNPLNGVGLKKLLDDIVNHYGYEILFAYLNINCFKTNPSIESSVKFLKKTQWAREKVEAFYLYQYKNLPRASSEQFLLAPRDCIIPDEQKPTKPVTMSLEDALELRDKQVKKAAEFVRDVGHRNNTGSKKRSSPSRDNKAAAAKSNTTGSIDPWAKWKQKSGD